MENARLILALISALCVISISFAQPAEQAPPRTIHDITALLDQHKPDPVKVQELKLAATREPPVGAGKEALAIFHYERAQAAQLLGMVTRQMEDMVRARDLAPEGSVTWLESTRSLSSTENSIGNFVNAFKLREQFLGRATTINNQFIGRSTLVQMNLAIGDIATARSVLQTAQANLQQLRQSVIWNRNGGLYVSLFEVLAPKFWGRKVSIAMRSPRSGLR